MAKKYKTMLQRLREEFLETTETLWANEVSANMYVARIMLFTAVLDIVFYFLIKFNVLTVESDYIETMLIISLVLLVVPALVSIYFKGNKNWLKVMLMLSYVLGLSFLHAVFAHNIVLVLAFPVVLSVRYYSQPLTSMVAGSTLLNYFIASYFGITRQIGPLDLNMVELPGGSVLNFTEYTTIRNVLDPSIIDYNRLFLHFLQHSFLPKLLLFSMIALICARVAQRGRDAIYAQRAETEKTQRLATELNLASEIQSNVLPNIFPVFPERKEMSLYASMTPAKEVGGDFYDFFFVDDNHIALVMADVSGKGVPAALFMMVARTLIKNRAQMGGSPSEILYDVNNQLCEGNIAELFVTIWLGIIDLTTGKGVAANTGHEHPVIGDENGDYRLIVYKHSLAVAAMEGMHFAEHEFELRKGDTLFIYTDGVAEATNADNELYGTDRMLEALNKDPKAYPEELLKNVKDGIDEFVQGAEQFDDITMMALKYIGTE